MTDDAQHTIGVRCHACGYVSYFDRRRACCEADDVKRGAAVAFSPDDEAGLAPYVARPAFTPGQKLYRLYLKCAHCRAKIVVAVDCEGYL
ncbi:MAG: hypothetical protein JXB47_01825 [Anaerolineae bacterium]|nr:hypothetical protein [Anaerolineae bacterium]